MNGLNRSRLSWFLRDLNSIQVENGQLEHVIVSHIERQSGAGLNSSMGGQVSGMMHCSDKLSGSEILIK